jgi:outer membrane protein insertion porin family
MTFIGIQVFLRMLKNLETDSTASASMKKQEGSYFDTFFNHTFSYDKRNQRFKTSDGYISRFTQNIPLISESYTLTNALMIIKSIMNG